MRQSIFERHPKLTIASTICFLLILGIYVVDLLAGSLFGLGKVVIYEANPIYGYRAKPNQVVSRQIHQKIKINNLGLRAENDWDIKDFQHKILFLGDSVTYGGSYISNEQLFSHLIGKNFPDYTSGNAGVNGWGVNNVNAFIKEMEFLPAQIYVSVFPEGDFYRGLNRIGGQPFWTRKPTFALEELSQYLIYKINLKKTPTLDYMLIDEQQKTKIAEIAVRNLKDLDDYLKQNNREHLIYITPSKTEILNNVAEDMIVKNLLDKYELNVIYIKDNLNSLTKKEIETCFHDEIHLSPKGHQVWAKIISKDIEAVIQSHEKESILVQRNNENKNT